LQDLFLSEGSYKQMFSSLSQNGLPKQPPTWAQEKIGRNMHASHRKHFKIKIMYIGHILFKKITHSNRASNSWHDFLGEDISKDIYEKSHHPGVSIL